MSSTPLETEGQAMPVRQEWVVNSAMFLQEINILINECRFLDAQRTKDLQILILIARWYCAMHKFHAPVKSIYQMEPSSNPHENEKKVEKKLRIPSQPSPIAPATRVKPNVQAVVRESSGPGQHAWDTWLTSLVGSFVAQLLQYLHSISLLLSCDIAVGTQNTLCKDQ